MASLKEETAGVERELDKPLGEIAELGRGIGAFGRHRDPMQPGEVGVPAEKIRRQFQKTASAKAPVPDLRTRLDAAEHPLATATTAETPAKEDGTKLQAVFGVDRVASMRVSSPDEDGVGVGRELDKAPAMIDQLRQGIGALGQDEVHIQGKSKERPALLPPAKGADKKSVKGKRSTNTGQQVPSVRHLIKGTPGLSNHEYVVLQLVFCKLSPKHDVLIEHEDLQVTREDLQRLKPTCWKASRSKEDLCMADNLVNLYAEIINYRCPDVIAVSSYYITKLFLDRQRYGNAATLVRWLTKLVGRLGDDRFLSAKAILAPIHWKEYHHWAAVVINLQEKNVLYFDSMKDFVPRETVTPVIKSLLRFIGEFAVGQGLKIDSESWSISTPDIYQQKNDVDCGVLSMYAAQRAIQGEDVHELPVQKVDMLRLKLLVSLYDFKLV